MKTKLLKQKKVLIIILSVLILGALVFVLTFFYQYFRLKLRINHLNISKVFLTSDPSLYSIENGSVLRDGKKIGYFSNQDIYRRVSSLGYFYRSEVEDPLFIGPEFSVSDYKESYDRFRNVYTKFMATSDIDDNFLPVNFLGSLISLHDVKKNFLSEPSEDKAKVLVNEYKKTLNHYSNDANEVLNKIKSLESDKFNLDATFFGSTTNSKIITDDFNLILKNADELKNEIFKRENLNKNFSLYTFIPNIKINKLENVLINDSDILSKDNMNLKDLYKVRDYQFQKSFIVNSSCFMGNANTPQLMNYLYLNRDNSIKFYPKLSTNNFYRNNNAATAGANPSWVQVRDSNFYSCNDNEYQVNLLNMSEFHKNQSVLLDKIVNDNNYKKTKYSDYCLAIEKEFLQDDKYPTEVKLNMIKDCYGNIYKDQKLLSVELKNELLLRYLTLKNKTANFHFLLNRDFDLDNRVTDLENGKNINSEFYYYAYRNTYSLSFLNFSPAVWRINERPKYNLGTFTPSNRYTDYKSLHGAAN
ncbi:hypothetical protein HGB13_01440 [bacterium]|nr:hypothetical protein [bacterium]